MKNVEKVDKISHAFAGLKEIKEKEIIIVPVCESCGKNIIVSKWNKEYHHINIDQEPVKRLFCSRQCKLNWIFKNL